MASKMKVALLQFKWTDRWDGSFSRELIIIKKKLAKETVVVFGHFHTLCYRFIV